MSEPSGAVLGNLHWVQTCVPHFSGTVPALLSLQSAGSAGTAAVSHTPHGGTRTTCLADQEVQGAGNGARTRCPRRALAVQRAGCARGALTWRPAARLRWTTTGADLLWDSILVPVLRLLR
jgi:hypothetical protein